MFQVYILKSELHNRYYVGHTHDFKNRLERHNKGYVKSTKAYKPWKLVYVEDFKDKSDAYRREMKIKSYKHGEAFLTLLSS